MLLWITRQINVKSTIFFFSQIQREKRELKPFRVCACLRNFNSKMEDIFFFFLWLSSFNFFFNYFCSVWFCFVYFSRVCIFFFRFFVIYCWADCVYLCIWYVSFLITSYHIWEKKTKCYLSFFFSSNHPHFTCWRTKQRRSSSQLLGAVVPKRCSFTIRILHFTSANQYVSLIMGFLWDFFFSDSTSVFTANTRVEFRSLSLQSYLTTDK